MIEPSIEISHRCLRMLSADAEKATATTRSGCGRQSKVILDWRHQYSDVNEKFFWRIGSKETIR